VLKLAAFIINGDEVSINLPHNLAARESVSKGGCDPMSGKFSVTLVCTYVSPSDVPSTVYRVSICPALPVLPTS
jgi:hypothetical protein